MGLHRSRLGVAGVGAIGMCPMASVLEAGMVLV
jgi:hypothetical protein